MYVIERDSHRHWAESKWVVLAAIFAMLLVVLATQSAGQAAPPQQEPIFIVSPWSGVFHSGEYPGSPPFVEVGSEVAPDTVVAMIQDFMVEPAPRLLAVRAGVSGTIRRVLVDEGQVVMIGQPLFEVVPTDSAMFR